MNTESAVNDRQKARGAEHFESSIGYWDDVYVGRGFDAMHIQTRRELVLKFVEEFFPARENRILDLACGAGRTTLELLSRDDQVQGLDISSNMLQCALGNAEIAGLRGRVDFAKGDADRLPFQDSSFGLIISMGLIGYMTEWQRSAREMVRVVKTGGYIILTYQNKLALSYLLNPRPLRVKYWREKLLERGRTKGIPPIVYFKPGAFHNVLCGMGLEIIAATSHGFGPFRLLGRRVLPNKVGLKINSVLQQLGDRRLIPYLSRMGKTYIVVARKQGNPL